MRIHSHAPLALASSGAHTERKHNRGVRTRSYRYTEEGTGRTSVALTRAAPETGKRLLCGPSAIARNDLRGLREAQSLGGGLIPEEQEMVWPYLAQGR